MLRFAAPLVLILGFAAGLALPDAALMVRSRLLPDAPLADMPYVDPLIVTPFKPAPSTFYYDRLDSDEARTVYRAALARFIADDEESIYLKGSYTAAQVAAGLRALQNDHPQMLCAPWGQKCNYYTTSSGEVVGIELAYSEPPAERAACRQELYRALEKILAQAAEYSDPFERELFLYDALLAGTKYDQEAAAVSLSSPALQMSDLALEDRLAHTAYGALVTGSAVCDGYAGAFQLLCSYAGIPSAMILGYSETEDPLAAAVTENHAWVMVELESGSYYCDPTWDDNGDCWMTPEGQLVVQPEHTDGMTPIPFPALHRYMNLPYGEFSRNHAPSGAIDYPSAADGSDNYYLRQELYCETPAQLTELARQAYLEQNEPDVLCFEARLGFDTDLQSVLAAALGRVGDYGYYMVQEPSNETGCFFFCLYG